ncbi:LysR family transcriptional regulator [Comamonas composti]|uniref:LysR family transcriptional regulator n=1 Tax=Comamonas composti TaxID=408558 RepID=UPI00041CFE96|nr:LysR family transcriptional regulator [Comamonas composti]
MAQLDLEWLRVFEAIHNTASVSRAAASLGMSQAAASTALGKLRSYFGDPLFTRTSQGMLPTARAQYLLPVVSDIAAKLEGARDQGHEFDPRASVRRFRICMTDISESVLLPGIVRAVSRESPTLSVSVEMIAPDTAARMEDGSVNLAVGFMPQLDAGYRQQVLFQQSFVCIAAQEHPRIRSRISKEQFAAEMHINVLTLGTGHEDLIDRALRRLQISRKVALEVRGFMSVARIVEETELIATVPLRFAELAKERMNIQVLPPPLALPTYAVKQHWHERFHNDASSRWLRQRVVQAARESGS